MATNVANENNITTPEVIILRGIPGSGKTTWAKRYIQEQDETCKRISRDYLRKMLHFEYIAEFEPFVREMRDKLIRECLARGRSVIVDDTNLKDRDIREIRRAAFVIGMNGIEKRPVRIIDFDTPLAVCISRDAGRARPVGAQRIREMYCDWHGIDISELDD